MVNIRKPKNALKFSHPASWWGSTWREALPAGNGVIGAAVYGGAASDIVMLSHKDLWWQGHVGVLQDVADKLKDVRKKMDEGLVKEAENIMSNAFITKGFRPQLSYPLPICDFKVNMKLDKTCKEYSRVLNMENGEISVTYKDGATKYDRSMFVSKAHDCIVYEITKTGSKAIDVHLSFDLHDKINARTPNAMSKLPDGINIKYENYFMYFSARSDNGSEFGAVARISHYGGNQSVDNNGITIKGADKILLLIKPFVESQREKEWKGLKTLLSAMKLTYEKMYKEHTALYSKLFSGAEFDLNADNRDVFVEDLLSEAFVGGDLPSALIEKLWAFGRYLMISGASPVTTPCIPYGLWCGDYKGADSQIDASGSLQTIYSHVLSGNLAEYMEAIFTYYETVIDDLRKNASRLYACRGIFVPSVMAHGTGVLGSVESSVIHFTGVAGWISQLFYDYYLYTDDVKFLKTRALPFMKETAMFYEEFFKLRGEAYDSCPSYSPNTTPLNYSNNGVDTLGIARNSTIDFAIAKELLKNLVEGSEAAAMNKSDIPKWKDMLTRIPDYKTNEDGTVKEYLEPKFNDNFAFASTSEFYPVFPGLETFNDSELTKSFSVTAKKRLSSADKTQTASTLSRYANIFARLGDGNAALDTMTSLVRAMAMNNLIFAQSDWRGMGVGNDSTWASYSIEPNMGITSALQEMLIQSDRETLKILPALPSQLINGEVSGLITRAGVEVTSLNWDLKKGIVSAKLKSKRANKINLILPSGAKKFKPIASEKFDVESGRVSELVLPAGKVISIEIRI